MDCIEMIMILPQTRNSGFGGLSPARSKLAEGVTAGGAGKRRGFQFESVAIFRETMIQDHLPIGCRALSLFQILPFGQSSLRSV